MKCPKCNYLGFETGDRCRNCGYDFSLISHGDPQPLDLDLELRSAHTEAEGPSDWLIRAEATLPSSTVPIHPTRVCIQTEGAASFENATLHAGGQRG